MDLAADAAVDDTTSSPPAPAADGADSAPINVLPPALGTVSAATLAASGIFTAYGAVGLVTAGAVVGTGLVLFAPGRRRRPRSLAARALRKAGLVPGSRRGGGVLAGSGRGGSVRGGAGRGPGGRGRVGSARTGTARSGTARTAAGRGNTGRVGSGRPGMHSGSARAGTGRVGTGRPGSPVRGSGRVGSGRTGRAGGVGAGAAGWFSGASRAGSGRVGRGGSGRVSSGRAHGGLFASPVRRGAGARRGLTGWFRRRSPLDSPLKKQAKRERRLRAALKRVRLPSKTFWVGLYRTVVPTRARRWLAGRWNAVRYPAGWWERLRDPVWRWRHGDLRPWEASVARFCRGMWDGVATVFERGDPRRPGYWRDRYGSLRSWEKRFIGLVLGSWLVLASPFRRAMPIPRMPDWVDYSGRETPPVVGGAGDGKENGEMSGYEQELLDGAEAFANAIENFCKNAPMGALGRALDVLSPAEARIAQAFTNLATRMRDEMPLNEDFIEGVDLVAEGHDDIAKTTAELSTSFRVSHQTEIERLENGRVNEEDWDVSRNRE